MIYDVLLQLMVNNKHIYIHVASYYDTNLNICTRNPDKDICREIAKLFIIFNLPGLSSKIKMISTFTMTSEILIIWENQTQT